MNCRQAKRLLPLWIGHDLADSTDAEELRLHLSECGECECLCQRLQESLDALQTISTNVQAADSGTVRPSLWPRLTLILKEVRQPRDRFNGWIPAAAMALAATLMVSVSVLQVRREMGHPDSLSSNRNLFRDARFAADTEQTRDQRIPGLVVQPANGKVPQDF